MTMVEKPRKSVVQNMVKNLIDSEIPEIQAVARDLAERIKQLEEHSWKLQHYATEIESLSAEEQEAPEEASLAELVRDLEKTLIELRRGNVSTEAAVDKAAAISNASRAGRKKTVQPEPEPEPEREPELEPEPEPAFESAPPPPPPPAPEPEVEQAPASADKSAEDKLEEMRQRLEEMEAGKLKDDTYLTPEGFVVRRRGFK